MNLKSKKGFTLVELIIVIAILGIIALIAVPNLTGIQQRAKVNADIRTAEQIGKAVRIWLTDTAADTSGEDERLKAIKGNWLELSTVDSDLKLNEYIPLDYVAKSYNANGTKTEGNYFITVVKPATDTTGADNRVAVAIGEEGTITEVYKDGSVSGAAYIEGFSNLDDAIAGVSEFAS